MKPLTAPQRTAECSLQAGCNKARRAFKAIPLGLLAKPTLDRVARLTKSASLGSGRNASRDQASADPGIKYPYLTVDWNSPAPLYHAPDVPGTDLHQSVQLIAQHESPVLY